MSQSTELPPPFQAHPETYPSGTPYLRICYCIEFLGCVTVQPSGYFPSGCLKPSATLTEAVGKMAKSKLAKLKKQTALYTEMHALLKQQTSSRASRPS